MRLSLNSHNDRNLSQMFWHLPATWHYQTHEYFFLFFFVIDQLGGAKLNEMKELFKKAILFAEGVISVA